MGVADEGAAVLGATVLGVAPLGAAVAGAGVHLAVALHVSSVLNSGLLVSYVNSKDPSRLGTEDGSLPPNEG